MLSPRRAPIERCSGLQHAHAYDDEDCREDRPQHLLRHPRTQLAAEEDAGQRANDERTQQYPIDGMFLGEGGNRRDPLANPLYADLAGLPPMYIQTGADDIARRQS